MTRVCMNIAMLAVCMASFPGFLLAQSQCPWVENAGKVTQTCAVGIDIDDDNGVALETRISTTIESNAPQSDFAHKVFALQNVLPGVTSGTGLVGSRIEASNIGEGVLSSATAASLRCGVPAGTGTVTHATGAFINILGGATAVVNGYGVNINAVAATNGYGVYINDIASTNAYGIYQSHASDGNYFAGKVGIGTFPTGNALEVVGNANFQGTVTGTNIQAKYQDVAEWVPSNEDLAPGTVVVLDPSVANAVMKSTSAYDTSVAGVVSAQPGIILGEGGAAKEQVATTGRVRVKVDASTAPIRIGDLLVTSGKPGVAMRSEAIELAGRRLHQPGTILGKALEALPRGEGEILVLLSLQ